MTEKDFLENQARKIIAALDTKRHAGHASKIQKVGHFSRKMFSPSMFFECRSDTSARMAINIFYEIGEEESDKLAKSIYEDFKKAAFGEDGLLDIINNEHASKKKKKKK